MAKSPDEARPTADPAAQAGPTDVTFEEALAELTTINGENGQQLAIARVTIRKQAELIARLQEEIGKEVKGSPDAD